MPDINQIGDMQVIEDDLHDVDKKIRGDSETDKARDKTGFWERAYPCGFWTELKKTLSTGWSLVLTSFAAMAMQPVVVMVAGHLGEVELAAVALSNSIINVFGTSIALGLASGCQTVFAQVYGGNNRQELGMHLQRSMCIILLALAPCYALHLNIHQILLLLHQDPSVSSIVAEYLLYFTPGLFFLFVGVVLTKYIQCQNRIISQMLIGLSCLVVQVCLQLLFVYVFELGVIGSALGQVCTYCLSFIFTLTYTMKSDLYKETWTATTKLILATEELITATGFDMRCLNKWGAFSKLAVASMLMMCVEWWAFELGILLAGLFGTLELAAQSVTFNVDTMFYCLPLGIGTATSIRVGHFLGSGEAMHAKTSARVGLSFVACSSFVVAIIFIALKDVLPFMFTDEMAVAELVSSLMPVVATYTFFDGAAMVCRLILHATGQQTLGLFVVLLTYYLFALPLGISLMFATSLKLTGLWIGYCSALIICGLLFCSYIVFFSNWTKLTLEAVARAQTEQMGEIAGKNCQPLLPESGAQNESSYGTYETLSEDETVKSYYISTTLIVKRVITVAICVGVLVVGIILRICLAVPDPVEVLGIHNESLTTNHSNSMTTVYALGSTGDT